jgi:hypothetical protein
MPEAGPMAREIEAVFFGRVPSRSTLSVDVGQHSTTSEGLRHAEAALASLARVGEGRRRRADGYGGEAFLVAGSAALTPHVRRARQSRRPRDREEWASAGARGELRLPSNKTRPARGELRLPSNKTRPARGELRLPSNKTRPELRGASSRGACRAPSTSTDVALTRPPDQCASALRFPRATRGAPA